MFQNWPPKCHTQLSENDINETWVIILLNTHLQLDRQCQIHNFRVRAVVFVI